MDLIESQSVVLPELSALEVSEESRESSARELGVPDLPQGLSEQQLVVLRALFKGKSTTDAAHCANVHRGTIWRWKQDHQPFRDAYMMLHDQSRSAVVDDLQSLAEDALLGIRLAVAQGDDPRLNLALLKLLGYFKPSEPLEP